MSSARPVDLSLWKKMWIKAAVKADNKRCKGDKVPLRDNRGATQGEYVFKEFDSVRKCILPSGSLCSNLNRLRSYYWKEKPRSFILEELVIPSKLSHMIFILDSTTCNTKEHIKLVDRLSDPSDRLIHQISHPSKEQISGKPNLACFICIRVHSFLACNPSFCKKNSRATKGPSASSTRK